MKQFRFTDSVGEKYKWEEVAAFNINNLVYEGFYFQQQTAGLYVFSPKHNILVNDDKYFLSVVQKGELSPYLLE